MGGMQAIKLSSANYGAWDWHWRCWEACGHQPGPVLHLMQQIAADNPKNYQLWNFRRRFALHRGPAHAQEVCPWTCLDTIALDSPHACASLDDCTEHQRASLQ